VDDAAAVTRQHLEDVAARIDARIDAEVELRRARREDDLRAIDKFEQSVVRRFDQVNEFRGALDDLGKTMATRNEVEALEHRIGRSESFQARVAGVLAVAVLAIPIVTALAFKHL
jgi:hypothetical protein